MIIIGITGTLGAGKGTVVDYLVANKGFSHYSVRAFITEEIQRRNLPVNRDSMVLVANDMREKNSPSFIVDELYKMAESSGKNCIIESIRTPGEIDSLRSKGRFYLFAVDAEPEIRYKRITSRASETDSVSFETFMANESREMHTTDSNHQNLHECIRQADYVLLNNGGYEGLYSEIETILVQITPQNL
jgi:dephospho-CoA kinase